MIRFVLPLLVASTITANAADWSGSYYCKLTASGGVRFDQTTKQWVSSTFNVADEAILVTAKATGQIDDTVIGPMPTYEITVKDFGSKGDGNQCVDDRKPLGQRSYVPVYADGSTGCDWFAWNYKISFEALRIQVVYDGGYMDKTNRNTDTPYVAVGKCDKVS